MWKGVQVSQERSSGVGRPLGQCRKAGQGLRRGLESPWGLLRLFEPAQKRTAYWVSPALANYIFANKGKQPGLGLGAWFQHQLYDSLPL